MGRGVAAISLTGMGALAANYPIGNVIMFASVLLDSAILIFTLPETVGKELE